MSDSEKWRRFKRMARHLGELIPADEAGFERACGDVACEKCGLALFEHPTCKGDVLHIGCDGRQWKL
jgi:hypothetical protein